MTFIATKKMGKLPELKDRKYHEMSFQEIDEIKEEIKKGDLKLYINTTQLLLYLNQMQKRYSLTLRWVQNLSILTLVGGVILIFLNWKFALISLFLGIILGISQSKLAMQFIRS